jgi:hypothetical protein
MRAAERWRGGNHTHTQTVVVLSLAALWLKISLKKDTERTVPLCALMTVDLPSTVGSHRRTVRSLEPDAMRSPGVCLVCDQSIPRATFLSQFVPYDYTRAGGTWAR